MDKIIEVRNVKKLYRLGPDEVWALNGVDLDVYESEFLSIMGPSGSGKSTLFNQIGALDFPTEGHVLYKGRTILDLSEDQQAWFRCNQIGYIFQTFNLIPVMTALQNVTLPMIFRGIEMAEAHDRACQLLKRVGLGDRLEHKPLELSGGQQQRVAVARAMANQPAIILADEPTGNLDTVTGSEIIDLLKRLNDADGVTVICSTHDPKMLRSSDRVCWLRDGRIEQILSGSEFRLSESDHSEKTPS
jgi:putative ABC transport system ATP-binding protein